MKFHIQLLDTDIPKLRDAAQKLRRLLNLAGVDAVVEEISCFLEITRQGYMQKLPVLLLDGRCMCTRYPLSDKLLEGFCKTLKTYIETQNL
jgi:hypothetical protein